MGVDLAVRLWRQGYDAIPAARGWPPGRDAFVTRMLGRRALVVRGEEGARLLYDTGRIRRRKAVPAALAGLLFGQGAVHGLDGREHAERKTLMMRMLDPDRVDELSRRPRARGASRELDALVLEVRRHRGKSMCARARECRRRRRARPPPNRG